MSVGCTVWFSHVCTSMKIHCYRVTDEPLIAETAAWPIYLIKVMFSLLLKDLNFLFLFVITAAGVVACDGCKKSPRTPLIYSAF